VTRGSAVRSETITGSGHSSEWRRRWRHLDATSSRLNRDYEVWAKARPLERGRASEPT
jgi:hypothetical protein